jgi:peptidoglycan/LPS O-acetylase OafA/YrhL
MVKATTPAIARRTHSGRVGPNEHLYWLDWIRFLAAFLVVACHVRGTNWVSWGLLSQGSKNVVTAAFFAVTRPGFEAVVVFFGLSGFLVGGKLLVRWREKTFRPKAYFIDRAARIYVPLIPALVLTVVLSYLRGVSVSGTELLGNLVGGQGWLCNSLTANGPLWSLSYEIWFYVLGGSLVVIAQNDKKRLLAWVLVSFALCVFTRLSAVYLFCWLLGAVAYAWYRHRGVKQSVLLPCVIAIALGIAISQLSSESNSVSTISYRKWIPPGDIGIILLTAGLAPVLALVSSCRPATKLERLERFGARAAAFSYTLYLIHFPVLPWFDVWMPGRFGTVGPISLFWFVVKLLVLLFLAWLFHLPFEANTKAVADWLSRRLGTVRS